MTKSSKKCLSMENLRHAEYYDLQNIFDELYARSQERDTFENLVDIIFSRENILLAYRNIKQNTGSHTAGTDKKTIEDIGRLTPEEVVDKVNRDTNIQLTTELNKPHTRKKDEQRSIKISQ